MLIVCFTSYLASLHNSKSVKIIINKEVYLSWPNFICKLNNNYTASKIPMRQARWGCQYDTIKYNPLGQMSIIFKTYFSMSNTPSWTFIFIKYQKSYLIMIKYCSIYEYSDYHSNS